MIKLNFNLFILSCVFSMIFINYYLVKERVTIYPNINSNIIFEDDNGVYYKYVAKKV